MSDKAGSIVSDCEYTGSGIHSIQLNLRLLPASALPIYKGIICDKKSNDGLAGMGDLACWYDEKHGELHVIKGASLISIELRRSGNPTQRIIGAMKKAVAKLK
jgi:hypothetical protein